MLDGETSSMYRIAATASGDNGAVFKVVVTNSTGSVTSSPATLTVSPVRITTQPAAQTVDYGQTAMFAVTAEGTGSLTFQWMKNGSSIASGATSNTYTTPVSALTDNSAVFTVVVTNTLGGTVTTTTSNPATLTVSRYSLVPKSGGFYDKTECVNDLKTGLVWEGKNPSGSSSRAANTTYTNYDSTTSAQKWNGAFFCQPPSVRH